MPYCSVSKNNFKRKEKLSQFFFLWFLEVATKSNFFEAIRGLGVPFVGNDKNKASNQFLILPIQSMYNCFNYTKKQNNFYGPECGRTTR
jgi:hypothetical protein